MRKTTTWSLAGIVAVALVAGAFAAGTALGDGRTPQPADSPTTGGQLAGQVVAGGGGSRKAADGMTPIGFQPACTGAVQAATSYDVALSDPTGSTPPTYAEPRPARKGLAHTLDYILSGDSPSVQQLRKGAYPTRQWPGTVAHPAWGGYKLDGCDPGVQATVSIFSCGALKDPQGDWTKIADATTCGTRTYWLVWAGDPADWRITKSVGTRAGEPGSGEGYGTGEWPSPVPAKLRRQILSEHPGWREYANAPR